MQRSARMHPGIVIFVLWVGWALSWLGAALLWRRPAAKRAGIGSELAHRLPLIAGTVLFTIPAHGYEGELRLWHIGLAGAWVCVAAIAAGLAFAWWARIHLGGLWSGAITVKSDHRIVDSGPYGIVRHPIYTGLIFAILATAAAKGTVLGIAGAALIVLALWIKAFTEERWLRGELGSEAYGAYARRVPRLIPFGPT